MNIFDGKLFAQNLKRDLKKSGKLRNKSMVIIRAEINTINNKYIELKRKLGEELGVKMIVIDVSSLKELKEELAYYNNQMIDGLMIQLPIFGLKFKESLNYLNMIKEDIDVDGLNISSHFQPAAVVALEKILAFASQNFNKYKTAIVGYKGMIGSYIFRRFQSKGMIVEGFDKGDNLENLKHSKIIISCTGVSNIIKPLYLSKDSLGFDFGYPKAEFEKECYSKCSFITPVPNGIGPVMLTSLFENLAKK